MMNWINRESRLADLERDFRELDAYVGRVSLHLIFYLVSRLEKRHVQWWDLKRGPSQAVDGGQSRTSEM
jgi:hypothetical protein